MKHYSIIKYHGYIIEGCGNHYELYHPDGMIGEFPNCSSAKKYVDDERKELDNAWNEAVLADY